MAPDPLAGSGTSIPRVELDMSGDIVLSAGIRSNLLALQGTAELQARTQQRLATGKKVNSALDNPINFFTASALTNRAATAVKAELSTDGKILLEATGANTIVIGGTSTAGEKAQFGLVAGTTAAGTLNATRSSLATQFDAIRSQIDQLAGDSGFNGVNLLNGDSLKVVFNEKNTSSLLITGVTYNSAGLGIAASTSSFQTDQSINGALGNLTAALSTLRLQASNFGSSLSVVQIRQDF